nr:RNA-directed DNA polymerase, eukaryota, reverse transcriptase zinc-binding domain protein [Tanacetum cinerariifolium]
MLKTLFRKLLYEHGNLHDSVNNLIKELDEVQIAIDHDSLNFTLREENAFYPNAFKDTVLDEERFLKQKEKLEWLKGLYRKNLDDNTAIGMIRPITNEEIKVAMFFDGDNKAPRPDGFSSCFFKHAWDISKEKVFSVMRDFYMNGKLLQE